MSKGSWVEAQRAQVSGTRTVNRVGADLGVGGMDGLPKSLAVRMSEVSVPRQARMRVLDPCDRLGGWINSASSNATGATSLAVGAGPNGEDCIRITATSAGTRTVEKSLASPAGLREGRFAMWVKSPDWSLVGRVAQFFFEIGGGYYQRFTLPWYANIVPGVSGGSDRIDGEWRLIQWSGGEMAAAGGAPAFAAGTADFYLMRFGIQEGIAGGELLVGPMYYGVMGKKATFRFMFDDSNKTDLTVAMPILRQYGWKATTYTIGAGIDGLSYSLTRSDLLALSAAGWKIGVHGRYSHVDHLDDDYSKIFADVAANQAYVNGLGVGPADSYAYPEGDYTPNSIRALRALGFTEAYSVVNTSAPYLFGTNPLTRGRSGTSSKTLATLKAEVDSCINFKGDLAFFSHQVMLGGSGIHTDSDIFRGLAEYISIKSSEGLCDVAL